MSTSESGDRLYFAVLHATSTVNGLLPAVEHSFALLRADSDEQAREAAAALAQREQCCYRNEYGPTVRRCPLQVATIYEVWPWSQELAEELLDE
ncbi:MAG: DUF4288 domain-containing protein [Pseudonocardiaceae bacterium]